MKSDLTILVVEDSPTQAERLRHLLVERGYVVVVASGGKEALAAAEKRAPSLVITDILMPDIDGYTLCRQIKSATGLGDVPVILLTSLSSPEDVIKGLECGADNFIRKPYEDKYLLSRIDHVLTNRELRKNQKIQLGVELHFAGRKYFISSDRQQILDLLVSTYEEAVLINQELARSSAALHALYRIAEGLNQSATEQAVVETTLDRVMELPGVQAGWITLWEGGSRFRVAAARGLPPALAVPGALEGECACRRQLLSGEATRAVNVLECERLLAAGAAGSDLRYHAAVPLAAGGERFGMINVAGAELGLFSEAELQLLEGVGKQVAIALERARLLKRLETKVVERTTALGAEIAERKKVEEARGRLAAILEATTDFVGIADPEGRGIYLNRAGRKMLGIEEEEVPEPRIADFHAPWAREIVVNEGIPTALREGVWSGETALLGRDGREIPVSQVILAHRAPDGAVEFISTIARDISEQKQLEEQVRQSQKMEAVGRLAGGVAHDFNNLLTAIMGYTELLLERLGPEDPQRFELEQIRGAGQRAASVTQQLLAFSRQQVLQPRVLDLNGIVTEMSTMLHRLIGEDVELVTALEPQLGRVKADPGQIGQVILNLALNARDAMPRGGKLSIETTNVELDPSYANRHVAVKPGRYVMLSVTDSGVGMDEETRARIFEPFFTTKGPGKGTGLGLSTAYGIVKQSGGNIWVYSEPARGTVFKIYLPRTDEPAEVVAAGAVSQAGRGTETILLVEDEDAVRTMACRVLCANGYTVLEAPNPEEAIRICRERAGHIDLLVTDLVMPQMSGDELARQLGLLRPKMKVLYMSGYSDRAVTFHGIIRPGAALLEKPFTLAALTGKVREVLDMGTPGEGR